MKTPVLLMLLVEMANAKGKGEFIQIIKTPTGSKNVFKMVITTL